MSQPNEELVQRIAAMKIGSAQAPDDYNLAGAATYARGWNEAIASILEAIASADVMAASNDALIELVATQTAEATEGDDAKRMAYAIRKYLAIAPPPDTVPRSELDAAMNVVNGYAIRLGEAHTRIAEPQAKAVPDVRVKELEAALDRCLVEMQGGDYCENGPSAIEQAYAAIAASKGEKA